MKQFYEFTYRYLRVPWHVGPREELISLVESERIQPCRAIDLGCAAGANAIYLAQHGFDVTGVGYTDAAIEKARTRAREAGVLDDLRPPQRELYLRNMLPLTHAGSYYLRWCIGMFRYQVLQFFVPILARA